MLVSFSRRSFFSTLGLAAVLFAAVAGCKCPSSPTKEPRLTADSGGGSGPMTVHGRANFYSPTAANLDVKVNENARPFKAHRMSIWWDGHEGTHSFSAHPNVSFNKLDPTQPTWLVEGLVCPILATDTHFRIRVIVYDKNGNDVTSGQSKYLEYEWVIANKEPFPVWHELSHQ